MLQGIGHQLIDDQACRHGDVDGHRPGIDLQFQPNALDGMRFHDGRRDFAEVSAKIDAIHDAFIGEQIIQ